MPDERHPALDQNSPDLPSLTLVLPDGTEQLTADLAWAICQTRASMVTWAQWSQRQRDECATSHDLLGQAAARGQMLAAEHVIAHLDESLVEAFDLWDQYERQIPPPGGSPGPGPAACPDASPAALRLAGRPSPRHDRGPG